MFVSKDAYEIDKFIMENELFSDKELIKHLQEITDNTNYYIRKTR
jgi:hypothetical protein